MTPEILLLILNRHTGDPIVTPNTSIIVETGTGVAYANSYASVVEADNYFRLRRNDDWDGTTDDKIAALVQATDYIETFYRAPSRRLTLTQGLSWPVREDYGVPAAVKAATFILASYALSAPLTVPAQRGTKSTKQGVGNGAVMEEIVYDDDAPTDPYPAISAMLAPYVIHTALPGTISMRAMAR